MTHNLDQGCILVISIDLKMGQNWQKFGPKTPDFSLFSRRFFRSVNFYGKFIAAHPGGPIVLSFGTYYVPWDIYYRSTVAIWQIFIFDGDLGSNVDPAGNFGKKMAKIGKN